MKMIDILKFLKSYKLEKRPWGNFEVLASNENVTVKFITVKANHAISLQTHEHRDELWCIWSGTGIIHIDGIDAEGKPGEFFYCQRHLKHRLTGGPDGIKILEIAFGDFAENDITRYEDLYGRK